MSNRFFPLFCAVFFLLGIGAAALGCYTTFFEKRGYVETTAVIDHVDEIWNGTNDEGGSEYSYEVYVRYTVDGQEYLTQSDYYQAGYKAGKEIKIFYNPADPTDIHGDSAAFGIYMMVIGPVVSAISVVMLLRSKRTV